MSRVTSKYQVSIPKGLAERLGIQVGDDLEWEDAGGTLRARLVRSAKSRYSIQDRLQIFDAATTRQRKRESSSELPKSSKRGGTREDLYTR